MQTMFNQIRIDRITASTKVGDKVFLTFQDGSMGEYEVSSINETGLEFKKVNISNYRSLT